MSSSQEGAKKDKCMRNSDNIQLMKKKKKKKSRKIETDEPEQMFF